MNNNINKNNNYPLTLDELPTFQSHKSLLNSKENENINTEINYSPNTISTAIPNNTVVVTENSKLHAFTRFRYSNELRKKYEDHLEKTNHSEKELNIALNKLRNMIYEFGLPDGSEVYITNILNIYILMIIDYLLFNYFLFLCNYFK